MKQFDCQVRPYYKTRTDGEPGRAVTVENLRAGDVIQIVAGEMRETITPVIAPGGVESVEILLPLGVGVEQEAHITVTLRTVNGELSQTVTVPPMRHWTVYVYPHSHVDIGYSNTPANVGHIHNLNIEQAINLAEATKDYPPAARYKWNTEIIWPYDNYLRTASPTQTTRAEQAVRDGVLCLDASYAHLNTTLCSEEELFQLLRHRREVERRTGCSIDTWVQVDVPGISWGLVPVLAQEGIRHVMSVINEGEKGPHARLFQKPHWWIGPDDTSKVLYFTPGHYIVGTEKGRTTGRPWFGQPDPTKIPPFIKTDHPRDKFLDEYLFSRLPQLEEQRHPYDLFVVTWALWDNCLIDADLPDAVKSWNEDYAYPRLQIAGAHEIMTALEQKYGDQFPVIRGDDTEYWTDGVGSSAQETANLRNAKERLLQAETLHTMLRPAGTPATHADFDEAWRRIILATEHTWAFEIPEQSLWQEKLWGEKRQYFRLADEQSREQLFRALIPAIAKSDGCLGPVTGPSDGGVAVFNTLSWVRSGLVTLSRTESPWGDRVTDDSGREIISQRLTTGELVFLAEDIPSFASRHYRITEGKCSLTGNCHATGNTLENGLLKIELDPATGNITGLVDTRTGWNFADEQAFGGLNSFRYQPATGGAAQTDHEAAISIAENGPLVAALKVTSQAPGCRAVTRLVRLAHGLPWVDLVNTVDKLPLLEKDAVHFGFGFNVPAGKTRVDIPWGVMAVEDDQWPTANRQYLALQHWLDVSNDCRGVTWCSLDAPLYEYGGITVILRNKDLIAKLPPSTTICSYVMNNHWPTNFPLTQDGPVQFRYRLTPHGLYNAARANRFGVEQAQPLVAVPANTNPVPQSWVVTDNDKVAITILKSTTGGTSIMRLRSLSNQTEIVKLAWPARQPTAVHICDRGEEAGRRVAEQISVPPAGCLTLRVDW